MSCQGIIASGPHQGTQCTNPAINGTGYCGIHKGISTIASTMKFKVHLPPQPNPVPVSIQPIQPIQPIRSKTTFKPQLRAVITPEWKSVDTCTYALDFKPGRPFYSYDFDDTIVQLRTATLLPGRKDILVQQSFSHNIVIFSNQNGIEKGKASHAEIQALMAQVQQQLGIPISFMYASGDDIYRKPATGMYDLFLQLTSTDPSAIEWYCGDAAGRKGDFNISDLYFANNAGLRFLVPEQVFNDMSSDHPVLKTFQPASELYIRDVWANGIQQVDYPLLPIVSLETIMADLDMILSAPTDDMNGHMIMMVGPQASGKSTVSRAIKDKYGYRVINNDTVKVKPSSSVLAGQKGIVIDNTNTKVESRQTWIALAQQMNFLVVIIHLQLTKPEVIHLTKYREAHGGPHIPMVAIHTTFKYYNVPIPESENAIVLSYRGAVCGIPFNHRLRFTTK